METEPRARQDDNCSAGIAEEPTEGSVKVGMTMGVNGENVSVVWRTYLNSRVKDEMVIESTRT
jgi:hypothetical protein